ncbi:hypothetical protein ABPG74_009861 [Tetrahymena malaccensis]
MDKRNYYTDSGNVNQKDVTFYTLSTGQTVVFICDVYGLLTWTVNLKDFSFQWNGYITNSTVIKQGDPFFSFTKHPTKDIIFMVLNIKSQFGLTWDNVQWLIHPFFLKNSVWVALALPYKPKTQNYLVSLINCQTGTIYNLTSNKSNVNKIQTTLAVVSLDDPNNLELIVLESSGTVIYVWDLNQSNFPFKFQTKINLSSTVSKYFVCLLQTELSQDANIAQYFETIKIQKLSIYNTTILNHFDIQLGQIQFVNNVDINIFKCINDVDFLSKIPDKQTSGCLRFSEVNALRINDINFQNKKEQDSNLLSVINIQVQQATISINKADISDIFVTQASMNTQATPVYIKSSNEVQVVIDQSNFQNVKMQILQQSFSYSSAALQVINSIGSLKISNTQFKNVYSNSIYGVIQTQTQNVVIDTVQFSNSTFSGNLQQKLFYQQGGFINAQIQNINISNTNFSQATASKGAFLFLQSSASQLSININDTSFSEGYAAIDGGSMFLDSGNNQISLKCLNCQFSNIYTLYNSASAISQQKYLLVNKNVQNIFQFNGGYIKNIFGYSDNHFIDVSNANLIFQDIPIITSEYFASDSQPFQLYSSYFDKQQATIANLQNTTLLIQNCNFCNLQKSTFSSAYPLLINSQLSQINIINATIKDSIFTSNVIQSTSSSLQIEQVQFKNISQILNKRLLQQDIYQIPSQLGYSLISTLQTTVQITKSSYFQDIYCNQNCNGGALQIQQGILNIQDTTFKNVYSNFGGSVFILGMNQTNLISNSNFINCSSQNDGGAIYFNFLMNDAFKLNINESIFNNNTCKSRGGAIYVNSQQLNSPKQEFNITNSKIIHNEAAIGGGMFEQNILVNKNENNIISSNQAKLYGNNYISYPTKLKIVNIDQFLQINNGKIKDQQVIIENHRSGSNLTEIHFVLANDQDEIIFPVTQQDYNQFQVNVKFDPNIKKSLSYSLGSDTFAKYNSRLQAFVFSNITLTGIPDSIVNLQFTSNQIYRVDPTNQTFIQDYVFQITIHFRQCIAGEQITQLDQLIQCQICPENYYSLQPQACKGCPNGASCYGGTNISTNYGYWRRTNASDFILNCNNLPDNCLGGNYGDSICYEGHIGALCEECDVIYKCFTQIFFNFQVFQIQIYGLFWNNSYAKTSKYSCTRCDEIKNNSWIIVLMTLWTLVSMCLAIKGDIDVLREKAAIFAIQKHIKRKSTIRQRLQTSIYMKSLNFSKSQMLKSNQTNMKSINPNIKMEFNDDEDKSGIYIKMLTNYIQIVGSIATFNLSIPSGIFQFPQSVGQPLKRTMDSLDCVLKDIHTDMPIIYLRLLFSLTLPAIYLLIFVIDNQIKQSKSNSEVGDSMQNLNQFEQKINQMNELEQLQSQEQKQQIRDKYLHYENPITQQQQKNRKNIDSQDNKNIDEGQNFQNIEGQNQETYTSRSQQCLDSNNLIIFEAKDSQNDISYTIETANQNQLKQDTNFERTPSLITLKNEEKQKDQILQNKYMLTIRGQASIQLLKNNSCQSPKKLLFENEIIEEGLLDVIKFDDEQMYDQSSQSNQQNEEASYKQEANNKNMQITNNIQVSNTDKIDNLNRKLNNNSINKNAYSMNYIQQDLSDEENQQTQLKFKSKQTFIEDKSTMNQLETNYENRIQLEQNTVNQNQIEIKFLS